MGHQHTADYRQTKKWCLLHQQFSHGEARLRQWSNRNSQCACVHAQCGGVAHDRELHPMHPTDQDGVETVALLAPDSVRASTAAPVDDEQDLFGREEEIMDFPVVRHDHVGLHQRPTWHHVRSTSTKVQVCATVSTACHSPCHHAS